MTKTTKLPIDILTRAEFDQLLRTCNRESPSGLRDRALLALLYGSGLRISEALSLTGKDLDLDAGTVRVHCGKGGKARTSGIEAGLAAVAQEWLDYRRTVLGLNGSAPVFCQITRGRVGKPVSAACVRQMLARRGKKAGIEKRIHCHGMRHSHAANLMQAGLPLNVIQKQLGHSNIATTSTYLDHVMPADVVSAVNAIGEE